MGAGDRDYLKEEARRWGGGGGGMGGGGFGIAMPGRRSVVFWLLVINIGVFFADGILGRVLLGNHGGMNPLEGWGYFSAEKGLLGFQVWRLLTFQFLHAGLGHILGNMLGLFFFGPMIEQHFGSKRFLAFYLLSGAVAALVYVLLWLSGIFVSNAAAPLVGASGGVFAILAAATLLAPNMRVLLFFLIPIPIKVLVWGLLLVAAYVVLAQGATPGTNAGGQAAHLGGALAGFILVKRANWLNWADRVSPSSIQDGINEGRFQKKLERERATEAEIDRILAKVSEKGLASLTKKEKKTLNQASESKQ
ncbi:rhomboid family protein [Algisphaera agarilytica]|uniref:Membrane associated rhomboid family serine protease n=1 Tax=Algisphaera agarilytica TaxID=1385975 RepID=A0A7X0LLF2_9BACT|nr:rhomboid family intramembrane serine protease [Algisphaera agarilytica]MBB6430576.1 membrane associated rhomboid family serine protease [Algisphaera agarilytica]